MKGIEGVAMSLLKCQHYLKQIAACTGGMQVAGTVNGIRRGRLGIREASEIAIEGLTCWQQHRAAVPALDGGVLDFLGAEGTASHRPPDETWLAA
jgi:hypothetical protein